MKFTKTLLSCAAAIAMSGAANAADLEVTHWWTSGGEAAAVAEFAKAFNATGNKWVDGAIAGGGSTARPVMISRITGGDPMGATQFNHGRQAEELVEAGLMQDLTELAEKEGWKDIVKPSSLLDSCTVDGRIYCVPVNIHSWQWIWLSHKAYEDAGVELPKNWDEFVATAPKLEAAGKVPLAVGGQPWQSRGAFNVMLVALGGADLWQKIYADKDESAVRSAEMRKVFEQADIARKLSANTNVQDWNQATNMVITGAAGAQIMGDWAQGEFAIAEKVAGKDYSCLPGLGVNEVISTGGDAFYFPKLDDPEKTKAQFELASAMMSKATQVAFNLKKGSLPVRGDIDLGAANDCMKKGLEILAKGSILPDTNQTLTADTTTQLEDVIVEFWNDPSITVDQVVENYAKVIASAE